MLWGINCTSLHLFSGCLDSVWQQKQEEMFVCQIKPFVPTNARFWVLLQSSNLWLISQRSSIMLPAEEALIKQLCSTCPAPACTLTHGATLQTTNEQLRVCSIRLLYTSTRTCALEFLHHSSVLGPTPRWQRDFSSSYIGSSRFQHILCCAVGVVLAKKKREEVSEDEECSAVESV